jgi:hypothetical protein
VGIEIQFNLYSAKIIVISSEQHISSDSSSKRTIKLSIKNLPFNEI